VFLNGKEQLEREVESITEAKSVDSVLSARKQLWAADLRAAGDFLPFGTGIGSHREIYPTYLEKDFGVTFTHAESSYVQLLLESGLLGLSLGAAGIALCGWWCVRAFRNADSPRALALVAPVAGGLACSAAHASVDFVWYIPACTSLAVILAACALRLCQVTQTDGEKSVDGITLPRIAWIAAGVAVVAVSVPMIDALLGPARSASYSDRYRAIARKGKRVFERNPELVDQCLTDLEGVLARDAGDARAHLRMASLCLQKFDLEQQSNDNSMPLVQIRDAALASGFSSREALDAWLSVAIGDHHQYLDKALVHSRQAVRLCPLLGEGYVYLAELMFLEGLGDHAKGAYIEQAMKVRPHSAGVYFAAGRETALAGDVDGALKHFKSAFKKDPYFRERIMELFGQQDAEFFLCHFEPGLDTMPSLRAHYTRLRREDDARKISIRYISMLQQEASAKTGEEAADLWLKTQTVFNDLGDRERALQSARRAVDAAPNHYKSRRSLAEALMKQHQYHDAIEHLQWCLSRYPENEKLKKQLGQALRHSRRVVREPEDSRYLK
jgi:tetratricopeptide (TPR) repeat protein